VTTQHDVQRVRREWNWQRVDELVHAASWAIIGLVMLGLVLLLGIAAANGRLTP
jgi:hypothetical protein